MTEHATLSEALVAAVAELTVIAKGRTANAGSYSYDYADLGDLVKQTRPVLAEHGLVALTPVHDHEHGLACTVIIVHAGGDKLELGPFPFPAGRDAQATGSAVTYHRRYALQAALGMAAADDDDDGAKAVASARVHTISAAAAKTKLIAHLDGKVPEPVKEHAAAVWTEAGCGKSLTDDDVAHLIHVADEYLADMAAMAGK